MYNNRLGNKNIKSHIDDIFKILVKINKIYCNMLCVQLYFILKHSYIQVKSLETVEHLESKVFLGNIFQTKIVH